MSNEYFQPGSVPAPNAPGSSAVIRGEFTSVANAFDKLPVLAGHADELVIVNGTGTGLITSGSVFSDFVTLTAIQTLTNKTIAWADNTFPGFGTGATKNAGTGADEVLLLTTLNQLPALDGSLLTGLNTTMISGVVGIAHGGTGANTLFGAQNALGITLKAPILSPAFTGAPSAPTPPTGDTSSRLATTFFVTNTLAAIGAVVAGNDLPLMDGAASAGNPVRTTVSREDHVHPSDTSRAPASAGTAVGTTFTPAGSIVATDVQAAISELDTEKAPLTSPVFTGVPEAPTVADVSDTTTKIATTAWVQTRLVELPVGVQVSDTPPLGLNATPVAGAGVEASRYDHQHPFPVASNIPNTPAGTIAATTVQAALNELDTDKSAVGHTHVAADVTNLTAALVPNVPAGTIAATTVQAALNELDTEKSAVGHTHVAANITNLSATTVPFTPVGSIAATTVQAAIAEVAAEAVQRTGSTGAAVIPTGTTAQRPGSPPEGYFRRNSELAQWEGYDGGDWTGIGGASGGGGNPFCYENDIQVTVDYSITAGKNAMSAGPIEIVDGITVTVPDGSVWSIV